MKTKEIINNTIKAILENLSDKLKEIETEQEVYFWDIIHKEIDTNTPQDNKTAFNLIEDTGLLEYADKDLIDNSNLNRQLVTSAYCCLEEAILGEDFFQELQTDLNNGVINKKKATEILNKIEEYKKEKGFNKPFNKRVIYEDDSNQVFLKLDFDFNSSDFEEFIKNGYLKKEQLINLSDGIKILTSNKSINQNAMVLTKKKKGLIRFYLMEKDKEIDIRNLLKLDCISKKTGFNLSPSAYIELTTKQYEAEKPNKPYLFYFKDKNIFLETMVKISQKLTKRSLK